MDREHVKGKKSEEVIIKGGFFVMFVKSKSRKGEG